MTDTADTVGAARSGPPTPASTASVEEFRPSRAGWAARLAVPAALVAFVYALPMLVPFDFQADLISLAAIFGCVALSMNVLIGYLGQLSLGHQAFYGIGAFASALVVSHPSLGLPFPVGLAAGLATGAVSALVLGYVSLRVRGLYLAIVTLAYGLLAEVSIFQIGILSAGVPADRPAGFDSGRAYAYICLVVLTVLFLFDWRLVKSKAGRAMQAIRDNEIVAQSFGINVTNYKLLGFVISGSMAGLAGALFAHANQFVTATEEFDLQLALTFVLMTVVGGLGNRVGVLVGAVFFTVLTDLLDAARAVMPFLPESDPIFVPVIGSALLVVILISFPGGFGQLLAPVQRWVAGGRFDRHAMKDYTPPGGAGVGRP